MEGTGGWVLRRGRKPRTEARDLAPSPWSSPYAPHPCRVLQLFLSRTAQRGPHLSNGRLLQRLGLLLLLVLGFLAVWTAGALERGIHTPLVTRGHTLAGRHFYLCHHDRWDYIMVVGELLPLSPPHSGPQPCTSGGGGGAPDLVLLPCLQTPGPGSPQHTRQRKGLLRRCLTRWPLLSHSRDAAPVLGQLPLLRHPSRPLGLP